METRPCSLTWRTAQPPSLRSSPSSGRWGAGWTPKSEGLLLHPPCPCQPLPAHRSDCTTHPPAMKCGKKAFVTKQTIPPTGGLRDGQMRIGAASGTGNEAAASCPSQAVSPFLPGHGSAGIRAPEEARRTGRGGPGTAVSAWGRPQRLLSRDCVSLSESTPLSATVCRLQGPRSLHGV